MRMFQIGYRHENGDVEGFIGTGPSADSAERAAIAAAETKCRSACVLWDSRRLLRDDSVVSAGEKSLLMADWSLEAEHLAKGPARARKGFGLY